MAKRIEDLVFTDDYMFGAVMRDEEICKKVLERVLKIQVDHVEYPELQKVIKPYYESKGVRLDVYVKGSDQVFDVEVQASEPVDIAKRTRYYQSMVDIDCLASGQHYDSLPKSYIIFLCKKDWLETGLPVATFQNICIQNKNIYLQDDCVKIFVNSELWEKESDIETRAFMNYLYTCEATDKLTSEINRKVDLTKLNEIFRNDYLSMNIHDYDLTYKAKKEGIAEGIKEGIKTGIAEGIKENKLSTAKAAIQEGISLETVAKICNLPLEQVQELSEQVDLEKQN